MIISLIGPSGSGKGTQAALLAERLGVPSISLGQMMREEKEAGTDLGNKLSSYTDQGKWVPSELLATIFEKRLAQADCQEGFVLDGTPRKKEDISLMDRLLKECGQKIDLVVHLDTARETTLARINQRLYQALEQNKEVRADETLEAVTTRLSEYERTVEIVLSYYKKKGMLARVDNEGPVDNVAEAIWEEVRGFVPNRHTPS